MDDWERRIQTGVDTARFLIVFLSPNYFQSEYCAREFEWWLGGEKRRSILNEGVAPILIVDVPGLYNNGTVTVNEEARKYCPRWVSELSKRQCLAKFDLREGATAKIDKTLDTLYEVCRERVWRQDSASKSPHNNSYLNYNENFVGRHEDLRSLHRDLETHRHVVLNGLGGVGKTELALTYGHALLGTTNLAVFTVIAKIRRR